MRVTTALKFSFSLACALACSIGVAQPATAQLAPPAPVERAVAPPPNMEVYRRPLPMWSQSEREWAFGHWDKLTQVRVIKRGNNVKALPTGAPLPGFGDGTDGAAKLEKYIQDNKVAGLLVLHDGKIRLERYALGHSAAQAWTSFSVAKSITSTLVGVAVKDGFIKSLDDPLTKYIKGLNGSAYDGVTVKQLLTMTTGVKWNEDYTDPKADVFQIFANPPDPDTDATVSYMRKLKRDVAPGTKWLYSTGETNLLGVLVSQATGRPLAKYLSEKIWSTYGMEQDASWQLGVTDHEQAGCCLNASLRDYARFGQFVLDGGKVDGKAIVPDTWFAAATTKQADIGAPGRGYGYQWWTRDNGSFAAQGIYGQLINIDPARKLVVVVNSAWPVATGQKEAGARNALLNAITMAVDSEKKVEYAVAPAAAENRPR
jgi:CubicO group peptidase (beta-lactamase class C family)